MKLSKQTLDIIKSFSMINQGILIRKGNVLKTVSTQKNVMAVATIEETLENEFAVYNLNEFLSVLSSSASGDVDLKEQKFEMSDDFFTIYSKKDTRRLHYGKASESMIITPPEKDIVFPDIELTLTIQEDTLTWILTQASNLRLNTVAIKSDGKEVLIATHDSTNAVIHSADETIGEGNGDKFEFILKMDCLTLLPGDYDIALSSKGVSHWKNKNIPLEYWITTEKGSFYQKA
jgi:hypothetical protein